MISNDIYKKDSTGRARFWRYEVDGPRWRSIAGICGGTEVTSGWTTCEPKSQDTAEAQALFEAQAEEKKKLERVYRRTLVELSDGSAMMFEPMLAKKFEEFPGRCYSQPKLDGIRCVATAEGLFSRQGKPITGLPHIEEALGPFFDVHPDVTLDGELYNHDMKDQFEKIVSAVRKKSGHPDAGKVQYHIYDAYLGGDEPFSTRLNFVRDLFDKWAPAGSCLVPVGTVHVGSADLLDALYGEYMENGYEGQMVRLDRPYENKRSGSLLKRKEFDDGEYKISAVLEGQGNWAGYAKKLEIVLPDGRICGAGIKGNQADARKMLAERSQYRGGTATIRHFGFTNDGMPRFPVAVATFKGQRDL